MAQVHVLGADMGRPPLTPPDCDLRGAPWMKLHVDRLLNSDWWLSASLAARGAAVEMWARSWHQVPAGSLPAADRAIQRLCGISADEWASIRGEVLGPWVLCADGRLYHPVVCEVALEVHQTRVAKAAAGREAVQRRWSARRERDANGQRTDSEPNRSPNRSPIADLIQESRVKKKECGENDRSPNRSPIADLSDARAKARDPHTPKPKQERRKPETSWPFGDGGIHAEALQAAKAKRPDLTAAAIGVQWRRFRDYSLAKDSRWRDWLAAWRNWIDRADGGSIKPAGRAASSTSTTSEEGLLAALEENAKRGRDGD